MRVCGDFVYVFFSRERGGSVFYFLCIERKRDGQAVTCTKSGDGPTQLVADVKIVEITN